MRLHASRRLREGLSRKEAVRRRGKSRRPAGAAAANSRGLRRSAHEGQSSDLLRPRRRGPEVGILQIGLLVVRPRQGLKHAFDNAVVTALGGIVRLEEHPVARDELGRGGFHLRSPLLRGPAVRGHARRIAVEPGDPCGRGLGIEGLRVAEGARQVVQGWADGLLSGHREEPKEHCEICLRGLHGLQEVRPQLASVLVPCQEPQLPPAALAVHLVEVHREVLVQRSLQRCADLGALALRQGLQQGIRQGHAILLRGSGLPRKCVATHGIRRERLVQRVVGLHEAERTIVQGSSTQQAVVRVHVALHVPHA
mmetsp:Transcript_1060/g.4369  ORF Transcript_1060/g.4369 Transcript_1060/m.4369 type:complete len:310 (-) Transcript_1060:1213-2142(-)